MGRGTMRSILEGHRRVLLTFWRGDNVTFITAQLKPLPFRGGVGVGLVELMLRLTDKPHPSAATRLLPSPEGEGRKSSPARGGGPCEAWGRGTLWLS